MADYYIALEIKRTATGEEIAKAYPFSVSSCA